MSAHHPASPSRKPSDLVSAPSGFDFRTIYHTLLEKAWVIVLCFVIAALLTAGYLQRAPRIYSATATLQVEQEEERVVKIEKVQHEDLRSLEILRTIEQTLKSRALLERVVETNNLAKNPHFVSLLGPPPTREQLYRMVNGIVDVRLRRGTRLIDITVVHTFPDITELLANSLVKEFMRQNVEHQASTSDMANEFLKEEGHRLKKKLEESEHALQAYKEKHSVSLDQRQDIVVAKLKELSVKVTEAKSERLRLETEVAQIQRMGSNFEALMTYPAVANDKTVIDIQMNISKLESDFANLRQRYKERHPKYIQIVSQLEEWRNNLTNAILKVPQTIATSFDNAKAGQVALEKALAEQEAAALDLSRQAIQYNVLAREVESDRALYDSILNRLKETSLTKELELNKVRVVQPAYKPESPFSPDKRKVMIRGLLAGLFIGIVFALGLNALDSSIKTVDQAEELLRLPVLSAVPQVREVKTAKSPMVVAADSKSAGAEAFRTLRTSLSMLGREEDRRTFLFTSALPQEGKTFCSLNFAACLGQQGLRTLLIDGDLRRPAVEMSLTGKRHSENPGVSDYLTGQKKLDEIVLPTEVENFFYIPAGTTAPNPAELLAQGGFGGLIEEALVKFDRVVIDSAPIHAVSDTLLMLAHVQTVSMVVRSGKTPRKAVLRAIQLLQNAGAPLGGVILNRLVRRHGRGYYYDPYYDYSYYGKYSRKGVYGAKS